MCAKAKIGKMVEVEDLRTLWQDEAREFTPWLAEPENIEILGDELGLTLRVDEQEASVGTFSADIVATIEETGEKVIIENQLERTNHDHLGKSIVYAAGLDATIVIWIAKECKEEHITAVEWLNKHLAGNICFYLVKLRAYRIGDSDPAPKFEIVCQPDEVKRPQIVGQGEEASTELRISYRNFWEDFNNYLLDNSINLPRRKANPVHFHDMPINSSKCHMSGNIDHKSGDLSVLLWIPNDKDLYQKLYSNKEDIERQLGYELAWDPKEGKKACSISRATSDYADNYHNSDYEPCYKWLVERLLEFKKVFSKYIN